VDVYTITRAGQSIPLPITWLTNTTWRVTLPLTSGVNAVTLEARDQHGTLTGTDSINITSDTTNVAASAANIVISEIHYHPAEPSASEHAAGYDEADDFQFIELHNISNTAVELAGSALSGGASFNFTQSKVLPPGGVLVLARNPAAFLFRYQTAAGGLFSGRLSHGSDDVTLVSATSAVIKNLEYTDEDPWPVSADGEGYSLILRRPQTNPDPTLELNWSSSAAIGGSPGVVENVTFTSWLTGYPGLTPAGALDDPDRDQNLTIFEYALRSNPAQSSAGITPKAGVQSFTDGVVTGDYFVYRFRRHIGVTDVIWTPKYSPALTPWVPVDMVHVGSVNNGDGTETVSYRSVTPAVGKGFGTLQVTLETP
jgi:hypothetical protein